MARYYSLNFCVICWQSEEAQELRLSTYGGNFGMSTIQEMYAVLQSGCNHTRLNEICIGCRLEILKELRHLHEVEDGKASAQSSV